MYLCALNPCKRDRLASGADLRPAARQLDFVNVKCESDCQCKL